MLRLACATSPLLCIDSWGYDAQLTLAICRDLLLGYLALCDPSAVLTGRPSLYAVLAAIYTSQQQPQQPVGGLGIPGWPLTQPV